MKKDTILSLLENVTVLENQIASSQCENLFLFVKCTFRNILSLVVLEMQANVSLFVIGHL